MIVILASRFDETSVRLAERWSSSSSGGACVMTCRDLSKEGWVDLLGSPGPHSSTAAISGRRLRFDEVGGVLVRLPYVTEAELGHIVRADRAYVASEMMAYLVSWLSRLSCPVLNAPSPISLSGPGWRTEEWLLKAAAAGIAVRTLRRASDDSPSSPEPVDPGDLLTVTVVGPRSFGANDPLAVRDALTLARIARVDLLSAVFSSGEDGLGLVNVTTYPRIDDGIADAILDLLLDGNSKRAGGAGR